METKELDLREYYYIIMKRIKIIIALFLVAVCASAFISYFVLDKVYESSATLIINKVADIKTDNNIDINQITVNQKLVKTYIYIVNSDRVLNRVIADLKLPLSPAALRLKLTVASEGETEILRINAQDSSPALAQKIANSVALSFQDEIIKILKIENVQIIDNAKLSNIPVNPKPLMNIAIAAFLSLALGVGIVLLIEYLDNTVKSPSDLEKVLGLTILGTIPNFDEE